MRIIIKNFLIIIFLILSCIHFYWSTGGSIGYNSSLPTDENGNVLLAPSSIDCIIVATILLLFAFVYTFTLNHSKPKIFNYLIIFGQWGIPILFLIRTIGDFKFVGLFKQVTTTEFAFMDTYYFTPLCLLISCLGIIILYKRMREESK